MSSYAWLRGTLCLLACVAAGCSADHSLTTTLSIVPANELADLPSECVSLAEVADADLMWARAEGDANAIVLDTPDGSCVARRDAVLGLLSQQHRDDLVAHIMRDFAAADPAPHPDISSEMTAGADPSPHPDKPRDTTAGDPAPHPDKNSDDDDDGYVIVVVVEVVVVGGSSGSGGTPPPAPPPAPSAQD